MKFWECLDEWVAWRAGELVIVWVILYPVLVLGLAWLLAKAIDKVFLFK